MRKLLLISTYGRLGIRDVMWQKIQVDYYVTKNWDTLSTYESSSVSPGCNVQCFRGASQDESGISRVRNPYPRKLPYRPLYTLVIYIII